MYEQPFNPFVKNQAAVKEYFKTPFTLLYGILQALSGVLSLIGIILLSTQAGDILAYIKDLGLYVLDEMKVSSDVKTGFLQEFNALTPSTASSTVLSSLSSVVIIGLIAAAIFMIYFKSRKADPASSPAAGFTILYVFALISLIAMIVGVVAVFALCAFMIIFFAAMSPQAAAEFSAELKNAPVFGDLVRQYPELKQIDSSVMIGLTIGMMIACAVAFFFVLFTAVNRVRYYHSVKKSLSTVELRNKGAHPYGVMCIVNAVFTALSLASSATLLYPPHLRGKSNPLLGLTILLMLSTAVSFGISVVEAKLALGYKKHIDKVKYGYNMPIQPAAPYAPFGAAPGGYYPVNQPQNNPYIRSAPPVTPAPVSPVTPTPAEPAPDSADENAYADPYGSDAADVAEVDTMLDKLADENAAQADVIADAPAQSPAAQAAPTCPLCGAEVDPSAPFCGNCGNRL